MAYSAARERFFEVALRIPHADVVVQYSTPQGQPAGPRFLRVQVSAATLNLTRVMEMVDEAHEGAQNAFWDTLTTTLEVAQANG